MVSRRIDHDLNVNRYITERKSSLHHESGHICPFSLCVTFQREFLDLEEDKYFFLKIILFSTIEGKICIVKRTLRATMIERISFF